MPLRPGDSLGPYEILAPLGTGGMGEVYRARDTRLGRSVAIKVLPERLAADDVYRRRLEREAKSISQLQHPHVCMLLDVGLSETVEEMSFLVMEYLEGETLEQRLDRGPLPVEDALRIGHEIAEAMEAAHRRGIVHRDLKPGNVMLTEHGTKVLDFGLAKGIEAAQFDGSTQAPTRTRPITAEGVLAGTVPYMAPEQLEGRAADARTDVWALGCVVYEMLLGERPFQGETQASLIGSIMQSQPAPVSQREPLAPERLDWVVSRCLEKDPEKRWQSARDVAIELEALLPRRGEGPVGASSSSLAASSERLRTGGRGVRSAALLAAVLVVVAVGAWWIFFRGGPRSAERDGLDGLAGLEERGMVEVGSGRARQILVVLPFENLGPPDQAYKAAGMTEEIRSKLAGLEGLGVISRTSAEAYAGSGKTIAQIGFELGVDYVLEGSVRWAGSRVRIQPTLIRVADDTPVFSDEPYDREISVDNLFEIQTEIAERVLGQIDESLLGSVRLAAAVIPSSSIEAYDAYLRGLSFFESSLPTTARSRFVLAQEALEEAVRLDPDFAPAWARLAEVHSILFHVGDQGPERMAAATLAVENAHRLAPDRPETFRALGTFHNYATRDFDLALQFLERAADTLPNDDVVFSSLGFLLLQKGRWVEGTALNDKAAALNPRSVSALYNTSWPRAYQRRYEEAVHILERVLEMDSDYSTAHWFRSRTVAEWKGYEAAWEVATEEVSTAWKAHLARVLGRFDEALAYIEALPSQGEVWTNYFIPRDLHRAWVYRDGGDEALAREHYQKAAATLLVELEKRPNDDRVHSALGLVYAGLGRKEDALRHGLRGLEIKPPELSATNGVYRLQDMALIYAEVGETEAALAILERLVSEPMAYSVALMEGEPAYASLRAEPGYEALVRKYR